MKDSQDVSKETKSLLDFIKTLPSASNVTVYTGADAVKLNKSDSPAHRRSVIRAINTKR